MSFHAGEIAVQTQAGVREAAKQLGGMIEAAVKPAAQAFLKTQTFAIAATVDSNSKVWASLLLGEPGLIEVMDQMTIHIHALPVLSDPLLQNLSTGNPIGILVIDLATRRRVRLNGLATLRNLVKIT
jgi:uncharacterized protein